MLTEVSNAADYYNKKKANLNPYTIAMYYKFTLVLLISQGRAPSASPSDRPGTSAMTNHTGTGIKRPRDDDSDGEKSDSELQVVVDDDNTDPVSPAGSSPSSSSYDRHHQPVKRERASTPSSIKSGSVS